MNPVTREDYYWLVSAEAAHFIRQCQTILASRDANVVSLAKTLRKEISPVRSAIVMEMAQLRNRARKKFPTADEMFFTRKGYEQSTSALIAEYKARQFSQFERVADICCGIGGDLIELAMRSDDCETIGVDNDHLTCLYAEKNLASVRATGHADVVESSFADYNLSGFDAIHIDPDRRAHGRTVQSNFFDPKVEEIFQRVKTENLAIKVAPASPTPTDLPDGAECEWIGTRRECKQQVLWCGGTTSRPNSITATSIDKDGSVERISIRNDEIDQTVVVATEVGSYIFEPHPCVLAARMTDTIANRHRLQRLAPTVAFLTGGEPLTSSLLTRFKVLRVMPLSLKRVAAELRKHDVGEIEVKNRGADKILTDQFSRIKLSGPHRVSILLTRHKRRGLAIIAKRQKTLT